MRKQFNVTVTDSNTQPAGYLLHNAMRTSDGNYRGVIYVDDDADIEWVEEMLEDDDRVVEYI